MTNARNLAAIIFLIWLFPLNAIADSTTTGWNEDASITYFGLCDGSAAVRIDDTTLLVANDETNVLHSFDIWGGAPVAFFDLSRLVNLDPKKPEIDFEAVARDGDRLWWIGSHGRNKNGKKRPNRRMLFATNVPTRNLSDIQVMSPQYDLAPTLRAHPDLATILTEKVLKTPPKEGGLNIEGMAFAPDGRLMLGLRAPLTKPGGMLGDALIVYLTREDDDWSVSSFVELRLKNRGIRDMVWADGKLTFIGGMVSSGGAFDLFTWSGTGNKPKRLDVPEFDGLNPESLVKIDSKWLLLSDDGATRRTAASGGRKECKDLAEDHDMTNVYFRARILSQR